MEQTKGKLFLLDAMALIYRAHFAFSKNPRINSKGLNTGAVFGFTNTLLDVLVQQKPTHLAIATDTPEPTFRHIAYAEYKAQRDAQPEDIQTAIPLIARLIDAFNIPHLGVPGYEADDVIGTLTKLIPTHFDVYMMTLDKDYCQLVSDNVFLFKPSYMGNGIDIWGVNEVLEKWEITDVHQVVDVLGLMGDASDNVPGAPGIGEKTAKKLIAEYGTIENLLNNTEKLKGKQKETLIDFRDQILLSKQLVTIATDVPVKFDSETFKVVQPDKDKVIQLFDELEFKTLTKRVFDIFGWNTGGVSQAKPSQPDKKLSSATQGGMQTNLFDAPVNTPDEDEIITEVESDENVNVSEKLKTIENVPHQYHLITDIEEIERLAEMLNQLDSFCFDTETSGLDALNAKLIGLSFSWVEGEAYYVPFEHGSEKSKKIIEWFKVPLENEKIEKIGQNIKFDYHILHNYGIELNGKLFDTMLAHYLIEPDLSHSMDRLAASLLNYQPISIEELIGAKGKKQGSMADVAIEQIADYAAEDADVTLKLANILRPKIERLKLQSIFDSIEVPLVKVLAKMERHGIKIDTDSLKKMSDGLAAELTILEENIYELSGERFNLNSPQQLGYVLFDKLKLIDKPKKTPTGQYATNEKILESLAPKHKIADVIMEYREVQKLKSTYIDSLPELIDENGRIHTSFNQTVAATGRLSSTNPNIQNIPIRTERGKQIREAFVPSDNDYVILSADYSQVELRIMAALSGDESMIEAFNKGLDIHSATAAKVFSVDLSEVTSEMRRKAKMVNFGIIYGISAFGLADRLGISRTEAADIINNYFIQFPGIKKFMDQSVNQARETNFAYTLFGRRRRLADINSRNQNMRGNAERMAINAPIQGTAADIIKKAMIDIDNWMVASGFKSKMLLQVHDELVFEVHRSELDIFQQKVPDFMRNAAELSIPLEVETGIGNNWLEAH